MIDEDGRDYCFTCGKARKLIGAYCKACTKAWNVAAAARHDSTDLGMRRK